MVLSLVNQILLILILIIDTIIFDRIFLKASKKLPSILDELKKWKGTKENFTEFKRYQYSQVFWQSAFLQTYNLSMLGIVLSVREIVTLYAGFIPWCTWLLCSIYPLAKFANIVIPRAGNVSIENIKILLEAK